MSDEIRYDAVADVPVIGGESLSARTDGVASADGQISDGLGCHAVAATMEAAARAAGNSELLDQFAKDYPQGPHDKPQSMCPAFG